MLALNFRFPTELQSKINLFIIEGTFWCQILGLNFWNFQYYLYVKKFWVFYGFLTIGIFSEFPENLRDSGFFFSLGIFIPGVRDFSFWARSKNLENPEIPGVKIGIWKALKKPEGKKIPNPRDKNLGDENPEIKKNPESQGFSGNSEKILMVRKP